MVVFFEKEIRGFQKIKELEILVEYQIGKKIKVLRTENGGELCGKQFEQFYEQCGIIQQNTTPLC